MRVKLALIGCGSIAQLVHLPALKRIEEAELVAICDIYEEVAKGVAEKFAIEKYYTDYVEMLEKEDLDAIINTTWHAAHAETTIEAAKHGKHVFVEKPMAVTIEECKRMIEACRRNDVKLMIGFMKRFDPALKWIREEVRNGSLGELFLINSWYYDSLIHMDYVRAFTEQFIRPKEPPASSPYTPTGERHLDLLLAHGVHHADLLRWIGGEIRRVRSCFKERGQDYVSTTIIEYENEATGYFQQAGIIRRDWDEGLIIHGMKGSAEVKIRFPYFKWRSEARIYLAERKEYVSKLHPFRDMYLAELRHFVHCILKDEEPTPNGYDGLMAQKIIYAISKSAKEERPISINEI